MENKITEFQLSDIEDVRILIKAKGKHFGIIAKKDKGITDEEAKQMRIAMAKVMIDFHYVVNTPLEDLNK